MLKTDTNDSPQSDIWCPCCGDRTYLANQENREIKWFKINTTKEIGICSKCYEAKKENNDLSDIEELLTSNSTKTH